MQLLKWMFSFFMLMPALALAGTWKDHELKIMEYDTKIRVYEARIAAALKKKKETESTDRLNLAMKQMVEAHQELKEIVAVRQKTLKHMRFRHPERGKEFESKYYRTYEVRSLKEYEETYSIEGRLDRIKQKVEVHYGVKPEERVESIKKQKKRKEDKEKNKIRLVK